MPEIDAIQTRIDRLGFELSQSTTASWPNRAEASLSQQASNLGRMSEDPTRGQAFPGTFNDEFPVGPHEGNNAFFGLDVLRGLVAGIDDFIHQRQPRWGQFRSLGPVLLGSAMWIGDQELIEK